MGIRNIVERNIFINDIVRRVRCKKYNKEMLNFVHEISQVDSIKDYNIFVKVLEHLPNRMGNSTFAIKRAFAENLMYGYANELLHYADLDNQKMIYLPLLEHGINFADEIGYGYKKNMSYIFQGKSKEAAWVKAREKIPAYYIGPFIHYVRNYYNEEQIAKLKAQLGHTLLVFPPHSTETGKVSLSLNEFDDYLFCNIGKKYDTIIACVFWADAESDYTNSLAARGAKLVSAGFKMDPLFAQRLKTIINIADTVLFPGSTTAIGYAYYGGKKVIYLDYEENITDTNVLTDKNLQVYQDGIMRTRFDFAKAFSEDSEITTQEKNTLINYYWGLDEIKTPEQIREIYFSNRQRIKKHWGF